MSKFHMIALTLLLIAFWSALGYVKFFTPVPRLSSRTPFSLNRLNKRAMVSEGIDVSLIPQLTTQSNGLTFSTEDIQSAAIAVAGIGYFLYDKRPRGSARDDLLVVQPSQLVRNNLGVVAKTFIPKDTPLGAYPGYLRPIDLVLSSKDSDAARSAALRYLWTVRLAGIGGGEKALDPTDSSGRLPLELSYLFGTAKVSTTLARINEPPVGKDVNVYSRELSDGTVELLAERNIFAGEELFMDYGATFDRTDYSSTQYGNSKDSKDRSDREHLERERAKAAASREQAARLREEEEMLTVQPILGKSDAAAGKVDVTTTNPEGYISKLGRKNEEKYKKVGILSPDDAAQMFSERGIGMFAGGEDQELVDSLFGKSSGPASSKQKSRRGNGMDGNDEDADVLQSMMKLLGATESELQSQQKQQRSDGTGSTGSSSGSDSSESKFGSAEDMLRDIAGVTMRNSARDDGDLKRSSSSSSSRDSVSKRGTQIKNAAPSSSSSSAVGSSTPSSWDDDFGAAFSRSLDKQSSSPSSFEPSIDTATAPPTPPSMKASQSPGDVSSIPAPGTGTDTGTGPVSSAGFGSMDTARPDETLKTRPALSAAEAAEIQSRLDDLTDEQVERVFAKLRSSLGQRLVEEALTRKSLQSDGVGNEQQDKEQEGQGKIRKTMPKPPAIDPTVRAKYRTELDEIENELEKMYQDPLKVWQDLVNQPEKFLGEKDDSSNDSAEES